MSGYGQQNRLSLSSWFLRGRDSRMDHVPGLGPVRVASLEGFVGVVTRRCLRRSELRLGKKDACQPAAHDASTIHEMSHQCANDIARKSRRVSRVPDQLLNAHAMPELINDLCQARSGLEQNYTTS